MPPPGKRSDLKGHTASVNGAAFSPDNKRIVTASDDHTARVWDCRQRHVAPDAGGPIRRSGQRRLQPRRHSHRHRRPRYDRADLGSPLPGTSSTPSPATKPTSSTASLQPRRHVHHQRRGLPRQHGADLDANTGALVKSLEGHVNSVHHPMFNPAGTLVVTASDDQTVKIWDVSTWQVLVTLTGHTNRVRSAAFSAPTARASSAPVQDQTSSYGIPSARSGPRSWAMRVRSGASSIADGKRVVTASADGTARVWDPATGRAAADAGGPQR